MIGTALFDLWGHARSVNAMRLYTGVSVFTSPNEVHGSSGQG